MNATKSKQFLIQCPADIDEAALTAALSALNVTVHKHALVDTSFGDLRINPASLSHAKELVKSIEGYIPKEAITLVKNKTKFLTKEFVFKMLNAILANPAGTKVSKTIESTQEMIDEVQLYVFKQKLDVKDGKMSNQSQFFKVTPDLSVFSFLKDHENYKGAELVDEYIADIADDYRPIYYESWKEGAPEIAIIRKYLEFYKQFSHRDVEVEIKTL